MNGCPRARGIGGVARDLCGVILLVLGPAASAVAQQSVTITLPTTVTFAVGTTGPATGSPNPTLVSFSTAVLLPGRVLRISVIADSANFSGPGGTGIPSSGVSWTVSNASGGTGSAGTLSAAGYTQVFQSNVLALSGGFDMTWTLAQIGPGTLAGTHTLTLRWRLESVSP
jgi:hypothetical protein